MCTQKAHTQHCLGRPTNNSFFFIFFFILNENLTLFVGHCWSDKNKTFEVFSFLVFFFYTFLTFHRQNFDSIQKIIIGCIQFQDLWHWHCFCFPSLLEISLLFFASLTFITLSFGSSKYNFLANTVCLEKADA